MTKLLMALLLLTTSAAFAQNAPASDQQKYANGVIQSLQAQRNAASDQAASLQAQVFTLQEQLKDVQQQLAKATAPKGEEKNDAANPKGH